MSMKAFRWAKAQEGLTSAEKFVLVMLGDHFNDEWHRSWPSYATLAGETGLSVSTVKRSIKALRARGLVTVEAWMLNDGAISMPNRYLLPRYDRELPAAEQPVLAMAYFESSTGWDGLVKVPGSNLYIEEEALSPVPLHDVVGAGNPF